MGAARGVGDRRASSVRLVDEEVVAVRFRRSKKFGPFRITATGSGFSLSTGVKGFRMSANTRGEVRRTIRIPGTGLYDTKLIGSIPSLVGPASSSGSTGSERTAEDADGSVDGVVPVLDPALEVECVDGTGGTRDLSVGDPSVTSLTVVDVPGGSRAVVGLAAAAGLQAGPGGRIDGTRDGLVVDRGARIDVVVVVTPADNPALFSWWERRSGAPKGLAIGRLAKRDEPRWRSFGATVHTVRVMVHIDVTEGLDPVFEVRFRPALLEDR